MSAEQRRSRSPEQRLSKDRNTLSSKQKGKKSVHRSPSHDSTMSPECGHSRSPEQRHSKESRTTCKYRGRKYLTEEVTPVIQQGLQKNDIQDLQNGNIQETDHIKKKYKKGRGEL